MFGQFRTITSSRILLPVNPIRGFGTRPGSKACSRFDGRCRTRDEPVAEKGRSKGPEGVQSIVQYCPRILNACIAAPLRTPEGLADDPGDPMGKLFFNILATFAEFEADLIRMRTREGMAIARARGKLRGKQAKLSDRQQRELCRMHATGEYSISDLAELFSVSRPTVYRTLNRRHYP